MTALIADVGQVAGPVLASLLFLVSGWPGAFVCAVFGVAGALLSLPARGLVGSRRPARVRCPSLRESPTLVGLLCVSVVFGGSLGIVNVAVPAAAGRWGHAALAGPLLGLFAAGSVTGGLWYGTRHWRAPVLERYLRAAFALGLLLAPAALRGNRRAARTGAVRRRARLRARRTSRSSRRSTSSRPEAGPRR